MATRKDTISPAFRDYLNESQRGIPFEIFKYIEEADEGTQVKIIITATPNRMKWYDELKANWKVK